MAVSHVAMRIPSIALSQDSELFDSRTNVSFTMSISQPGIIFIVKPVRTIVFLELRNRSTLFRPMCV